LKPWQKCIWCIAPKENARFVAAMEDVLTVYKRPYDPRYPQVCLDEGSKQLVSTQRETVPMQPGKPRREDYEYEREGFCSVFVACEPLAGKRVLEVRPRRTARDWAEFVRDLIEVQYPKAEKIVLVMDNLNTHVCASLYETFPKEKAWELSQKLEIHYTPVHGSWLNMAEIELSVLARQVLKERMASVQEVQEAVASWQHKRNHMQATIQWHFTTQDARIKLQHLYPKVTNED
jgi:DDE superfamily endonuclease